MLYICVGDGMDIVFSVNYEAWNYRCSCMGSVSFVMQMLYVCVLCASCDSP